MKYAITKEAVLTVKTGAGMSTITIDKSLSQKQLKELYDNGYTNYIEKLSSSSKVSQTTESSETIETADEKIIAPTKKKCTTCKNKK